MVKNINEEILGKQKSQESRGHYYYIFKGKNLKNEKTKMDTL